MTDDAAPVRLRASRHRQVDPAFRPVWSVDGYPAPSVGLTAGPRTRAVATTAPAVPVLRNPIASSAGLADMLAKTTEPQVAA